MPFFKRQTEEEKQAEVERKRAGVERQARQQASLQALAQGGIPVEAQARLADLKQQGGRFFTSDLSVSEFLLARQVGFRPLTQVMGSSVYHVGWRNMPNSNWRRWSGSRELDTVSHAFNHARMLALGRMQQEAQQVGAHVVVGVRIIKEDKEWADDMIEFNAVGTAIRLDGMDEVQHPPVTNLSGQEFWKLYQAGYWPIGVAASTAVFYVVASWNTRRAMGGGGWFGSSRTNQELEDFTQGMYVARHLAMNHVRSQATQLGCQGLVGMTIEQDQEEHEVEVSENNSRTDMIFTFHVLGTAITELPDRQSATRVFSAVNLKG